MECKCDEAKAYQEKKEREERLEAQKLSAKGTTFELFHNDFLYFFGNQKRDHIVKNLLHFRKIMSYSAEQTGNYQRSMV